MRYNFRVRNDPAKKRKETNQLIFQCAIFLFISLHPMPYQRKTEKKNCKNMSTVRENPQLTSELIVLAQQRNKLHTRHDENTQNIRRRRRRKK